jgi:hypothetical protein
MQRLAAILVLFVLAAGPVFAAVPTTGMMEHCMDTGMPCHDQAVLSCCSTDAHDAAPAAARVVNSTGATVAPNHGGHVVAVVTSTALPGFASVNASPPHGYQSGDLLSRLSTLLI